jgi:hypothetical protein
MAEVIPERLYDAARREGIDVESEEQLAIWAVWCCADSFPDLTVGDFRALRAFAKERAGDAWCGQIESHAMECADAS